MVIYDNKKLIPAPFVSITKEYQTTDDGKIIGTIFVITLKGTIIADRGSPKTDGTFWALSDYPPDETISADDKLAAILRKQEAIRSLFKNEGLTLEIQSVGGSTPMKCNPRVKRIEFPEGGQGRVSWVDKCDYIITLEADKMYPFEETGNLDTYKISKANEEWNIEQADEKHNTWRLTHSVSATGKRFYTEENELEREAWEQARLYVLNVLGLGISNARMVAEDVLDNDSLQAFNYVRTENVNELGGTYQVTETWLCYDPGDESPALDEYTVNVRTNQEGRTTVSIEGTITGLEVRNTSTRTLTSSRYTNAAAKWTTYVQPELYSRATTISGVTLHTQPVNTSIGKNEKAGTISYQYEYDDRANTDTVGAISESITVVNHHATDIFAAIPVLGRAAGPVLQDIGTVSTKKRTIQIEVVMRAKTQSYTPSAPDTDAVVLSLIPVGTQVFLEQDEESWSTHSGRYSRTTAYTWQ